MAPEDLSQVNSLMSRYLRSLDEPEEAPPRAQFSQFYTPDFVKERVNQLRGNNTFGGLLAMSGDRALAPVGEMLMRQSDPNEFMQEAAQQEQVRQYQQWQADYGARSRSTPSERLERALGLTLDVADARKRGAEREYQNVPVGVARELPELASSVSSLQDLQTTFSPLNQQVLGEYQSFFENVPATSVHYGLERALARAVEKGEPAQKIEQIRQSAQWWANFKMSYEIPTRHKYFGAALTPTEQQNWRAALNMGPSTAPAEVRARLAQLHQYARKLAEYTVTTDSALYGADKIVPVFEGVLEGPPVSKGAWGPGEKPTAPSPQRQTVHPKYGQFTVED